MRHLFCRDAVGGKLVGVEDPADAALLRVVRHLAPETPAGLDLASHEARKPAEPDREDGLRLLQDRGFRPGKEGGDVDDGMVDPGAAFPKGVADGKEGNLPLDLAAHHLGDQVEVLDALDLHPGAAGNRDVDVLPDRPEAALHPAGRAEHHPDMPRDLLDGLGGMHAGCGGDLDERDPQAVEGEGLALHPLRRLFFEADRLDPAAAGKGAGERDECRPLEPAGVRAVDDEFPHRLHLLDRGHPEHLCYREADLERLGVQRGRGLLVVLHQADRIVGVVAELPDEFHLLTCRTVDLAKLALRRPEVAVELPGPLRGLPEAGRAPAEEFLGGVELLVDLDTGLEAELLVVHHIDLRRISPARSASISVLARSGSGSFPSTHISLTSAASGSISSPSTTPAERRSLPVL